ncbi:hypothetical protein [Mangrovibacterium diazotrophicum]|uniref:Uncharacterized protein n=1 Tax=Mangrovibacterium diazotrophicum TaxID=1261403 RepID=A0A419VWD0_9BACT|nr:hypothetical protein [Mangrovibacterium diazotrophicum]RKD86467.1 hypothetical protein BC643_4160 [Mangrovibacterium diazotrophicum]
MENILKSKTGLKILFLTIATAIGIKLYGDYRKIAALETSFREQTEQERAIHSRFPNPVSHSRFSQQPYCGSGYVFDVRPQ